MPFNPGDQVQLKSGGPIMTVKEHRERGRHQEGVHCQWFAGKKLESGIFVEESLEIPKDEKKN